MNCPFCSKNEVRVLDSRPDSDCRSIRRRRQCVSCNKRWRTVERIEDEMPLVVKKNGTFQHFDREKLLRSMEISCGKRPVSRAQISEALARIEWELLELGVDTVRSVEIGERVMMALRDLDEIAYIRYSSVYRRFKDVGELMAEVRGLISDSKKIEEKLGPEPDPS